MNWRSNGSDKSARLGTGFPTALVRETRRFVNTKYTEKAVGRASNRDHGTTGLAPYVSIILSGKMVLLGRFELPASSLPMTCSTPELQQHRLMRAVLPPSHSTRKT